MKLPALVAVVVGGLIVGVLIALVVVLSQALHQQRQQQQPGLLHTIYCKRTDKPGYPVISMMDGPALGTPAQVCAGLDTYPGETWVPTRTDVP